MHGVGIVRCVCGAVGYEGALHDAEGHREAEGLSEHVPVPPHVAHPISSAPRARRTVWECAMRGAEEYAE